MAKPELTKILIAERLKQLMNTIPLDKISVQDIVDACGINRKTFYYHFQDKQDLICWIFDSNVSNIINANKSNELLDEIIQYMYSNKDFYVIALKSEAQHGLRQHLFDLCYNECKLQILSLLGKRKMEPQNIDLLARYFSNAIIGSVIQWAEQGMKISPFEHKVDFSPVTTDCMKFIIDKYAIK